MGDCITKYFVIQSYHDSFFRQETEAGGCLWGQTRRSGVLSERGAFMTLKERAAALKRDIPAVFLALKDRRTPVIAKILAGITVAYALSPVDLIPDFVPVLGYLDDVLLLPGLIALTVKRIPAEVLADCRNRAQGMWQDGRPKKWYYTLPIAAVWVLAAVLILKAVF